MQGGDPEGALRHWQRAAELGSDNPFVYMQLATDRLDQLANGLTLDYRMPAELANLLRGWLDRAITLSPRYLGVYEKLAMVEAFAVRPRMEAINRVQEAVSRMKDKMPTLFAIAIIHWRVGDDVTACQIAKLLIGAPRISPQLHALAQQLDKSLASTKTPGLPADGPPGPR
jgi:hypothetical protein